MSQPRRRFVLISLVSVAFATTGLRTAGTQPSSDVSSHPWIGKSAPGFGLKTVAGGELRLEDLRGKYVVIHFGASW